MSTSNILSFTRFPFSSSPVLLTSAPVINFPFSSRSGTLSFLYIPSRLSLERGSSRALVSGLTMVQRTSRMWNASWFSSPSMIMRIGDSWKYTITFLHKCEVRIDKSSVPGPLFSISRPTERCCVLIGFYVPPTAMVIRRRDLGLKSLPKDWRSPGSNSRPLVYKASSLTTTPRRLLSTERCHAVTLGQNCVSVPHHHDGFFVWHTETQYQPLKHPELFHNAGKHCTKTQTVLYILLNECTKNCHKR